MDLLRTAVVDITTLVATCHALKASPVDGEATLRRKLRNRLRLEVKRGTLAYIDALARTRRGLVDAAVLATCRLAAEQQMARAMTNQALLCRVMESEAGSLAGLAAARQDLWRLAHIAIHLRAGMAGWRESGTALDAKAALALAGRLRRRLRKGLIAYARAALRGRQPRARSIMAAREAALARIGARGLAQAERLSEIEATGGPKHAVIHRGVTRPLQDLALDWQGHESGAA